MTTNLNSFVKIQNIVAQNLNLSFAAIGLYTYLKSLPETFKWQIKDLDGIAHTSGYEIRKLMKELKAAGLIISVPLKDDHSKNCGWENIVLTVTEKNLPENQHVEIQHVPKRQDKEGKTITNKTPHNLRVNYLKMNVPESFKVSRKDRIEFTAILIAMLKVHNKNFPENLVKEFFHHYMNHHYCRNFTTEKDMLAALSIWKNSTFKKKYNLYRQQHLDKYKSNLTNLEYLTNYFNGYINSLPETE